MLHYETVHTQPLELLKELNSFAPLNDFYLVGGTALSLQAGHRISIDLDFFSNAGFDASLLLESLKTKFTARAFNIANNTLTAVIKEIKVDFIRHNYPLIKPVQTMEGIRLLSKEDIAAMKLNSITIRGSKKDFYDLYELLKVFTLEQMLGFFCTKYDESLQFMVLKSLVYFEDADAEPSPVLVKKTDWESVKNKIKDELRKYPIL